MFPFKIGPLISATLITISIAAAIIGLVRLADLLRDGGKAEAQAEHAQAQAVAQVEASRQASDAATAREAAFKAGSVGRLRANWCRDCGGAQ